jgi:hypothetical protein
MPLNEQWEPLVSAAKRLKAEWPSRGFTWDTRLNCISSSFSAQFETKARTAMAALLREEFTPATLAKAPPRLREVAERSGGLRSGQLLLMGGPFGFTTAYGLWWPWGDGETISLRVGLVDVDPMREPYPTFRDAFGVSLY